MVEEYTCGRNIELTLCDRRKVRGKITIISEKTGDGRAIYRIWINNDVYLIRDFKERVIVTQSPILNDICLIVEDD